MKRRYKGAVILLGVLVASGVLASISAGIHVGNQIFTVEPTVFDAAPMVDTLSTDGPTTVEATLEGRITTGDGRAVAGALVTASTAGGAYRLTVYSDAAGEYRLRGLLHDAVEVRVRSPYMQDVTKSIRFGEARSVRLDFTIEALATPGARSEGVAASAHAALLNWPDDEARGAFVSQCHFCHQIGNALTRSPREAGEWRDVVDRMDGYLVLLTDGQKEVIRDTLAATFTGEQLPALQTHEVSPELALASIEEWTVGDGNSFIHDADVGADGKLYGVDEGNDVIWILDRASRRLERVPFPDSDLPVGGLFSGLALPIGIFTGRHGPHSLAQGPDGRFWITNALSSTLMAFDPEEKTFEVYPIGVDALYPHTIRIDRDGDVWFTLAASNQVARFEPRSGTFTIIDLPSNGFLRWISDAFFPLIIKVAAWFPRQNLHLDLSHHKWTGEGREVLNMPYGIDVNPVDGGIWYAKLYADRIGHIDPETLAITEFETPLDGPRRPRFDRNGILWIPSFDDNALMRFDPKSGEFRTYEFPQLAPGEYETPYALNVHPETGDVWITSNLSDRIFRFDPQSEHFVSYPSPTRVTFLRDLVFTNDGKVCSSQSNLPAYAIEGGVPSFICIDPDGADAQR